MDKSTLNTLTRIDRDKSAFSSVGVMGLSKRQYAAIHIAAGLMACPQSTITPTEAVSIAIGMADQILEKTYNHTK